MIARTRRLAATLGTAAMMLDVGCYAYQPMARPLAVNQRLRLHLTPEGTTELARFLGPRVAAADGVLARTAADGALTLGVEWVQSVDGARQPWSGEGIVTFPAAYVARVEENVLNRRQTTIAAIAGTVGVVAIGIAALRAAGVQGGTSGGSGGTTP